MPTESDEPNNVRAVFELVSLSEWAGFKRVMLHLASLYLLAVVRSGRLYPYGVDQGDAAVDASVGRSPMIVFSSFRIFGNNFRRLSVSITDVQLYA